MSTDPETTTDELADETSETETDVSVETEDTADGPLRSRFFGAAERPSTLAKAAAREAYLPQVQSPELERIHETVSLVPTTVVTREGHEGGRRVEQVSEPVVGADVVDALPADTVEGTTRG